MEIHRRYHKDQASTHANGIAVLREYHETTEALFAEAITALREADARVAEARRQALEEAALKAKAEKCKPIGKLTEEGEDHNRTCERIAAAIRDLAAKEQTP